MCSISHNIEFNLFFIFSIALISSQRSGVISLSVNSISTKCLIQISLTFYTEDLALIILKYKIVNQKTANKSLIKHKQLITNTLHHNFKLSKKVKRGIRCSIRVPFSPASRSLKKSKAFKHLSLKAFFVFCPLCQKTIYLLKKIL